MAKTSKRSFKRVVLIGLPSARLDYYESLRGQGKPCWFIREGFQGLPYTAICASPRAAWRAAFDYIRQCLTAPAGEEVAR